MLVVARMLKNAKAWNVQLIKTNLKVTVYNTIKLMVIKSPIFSQIQSNQDRNTVITRINFKH